MRALIQNRKKEPETEMTENSITTMEGDQRASRLSKNLENIRNEQIARDTFDSTYSRFPRDATNLGKDLDLGPKPLDLNLDLGLYV